MSVTWTREQQKVIDCRDRDILVSAAAGSGKTAVLVERIIKRITDMKDPIEIDNLLVVTFTKAAAAEMRERIGAAIEKACEEHPDNSHLRRQSALIHNAMITTIDSFCLFVVRNHFEEISLDPNFRIADEGEIRLLEKDTEDAVFEENYACKRPSFLALIDAYAGKKSDQAVKDMVMKLYRMSLSSPWPKEWLEDLLAPYRVETPQELLETEMIRDIADSTGKLVADMRLQLDKLYELCLAPDGPTAYAPTLEADAAMLAGAEELSGYEELNDFLQKLTFGKLAAIRNFDGDVLKKEAVQNGRNAIKKELEERKKKYYSMDVEALLAQLVRLRPVAEELVRLALAYTDAMATAKRKKRIVDFSDIEHFALQILVDEKTKKRKRTAEEFRAHFAEIMIDEYQDSNQVQEEIMRAISREEEGSYNMFMVGDVKQSIYRFRLARPELFMEKYASFTTEESEHQRIDLRKNFRSRPEVIDFCNALFYKLMAEDLGSVRYDADAALYCGAQYPENAGMEAELLLLDDADELVAHYAGEDEGTRQLEARMAASKIRCMMKEMKVTDKETGELRPLRYSDIVILFRSLKDWGDAFSKVLNGQGIPSHVESSTGYFSAIEVQNVLNLLRILDNPYQDIPMAAVLKSPMVGLDEEELAEIRLREQTVPFAAAALLSMEEAEEGPLARFREIYRNLRQQRELPIHELIQKILDDTGYGNYAAAMPAGELRSANLAMLIEKAVAYEKTSYRGLFHFVRYIDQLQKYEIDFGEADVTAENADVVHLMTIHKSKGLEYPVVFVAGLGKRINQMETNDRLVVHPELGMGICEMTHSGNARVKKSCIYREELADRIRRENLGEELRVLYVALTRAKEKLILTGVVHDLDKKLSGYTGNVTPGQPISYRARVSAASYLDWVLPAVLSYPEKYTVNAFDPAQLVWEEVTDSVEKTKELAELLAQIDAADDALVEEYAKQFSYEYPYRSEAGRKSKYSVSELKHASMERKYLNTEDTAEVPDFVKNERESYVPRFARPSEDKPARRTGNEAVTAVETKTATVPQGALRGTAVHRVMECMNFVKLAGVDRNDEKAVSAFVRDELNRLLDSGELTGELYDLIIPSIIEGFVKTDVAHRMGEAALRGDLYREKPFVMEEDGVLIQGIIDVFWIEGDSIVLLDYKTDRVKAAAELIMRYETQLKLYADALRRVFSTGTTQMKAEECLIYSFRLQEVIRI